MFNPVYEVDCKRSLSSTTHLLTMCGSTCAIIYQNGQYALVDSMHVNGRSVVYFHSLNDVYIHICCLASDLSGKDRLISHCD